MDAPFKKPCTIPGPHTHVYIWVSSTTMPGYLLQRCACGDVLGTRRISPVKK